MEKWLRAGILAALLALIVLLSSPAWLPSLQQPQSYEETIGTQQHGNLPEPFWKTTAHDPVAIFTLGLLVVTFILAAATVSLACSTGRAADAARRAAEHIPRVERAYVKMSHMPPGLTILPDGASIKMKFKNFGRTPANVTGALLVIAAVPLDRQLSAEPDYRNGLDLQSSCFLVSGDKFFADVIFTLEPRHVARIIDREGFQVFLVGFVDYLDAFGSRHRGGYARRYIPEREATNLVFIPQRSYNYDRLRVRGEGNNWD